LSRKQSLYANPNHHSNGEIQSLSNSNFILSKNNNQIHHSTININDNTNNYLINDSSVFTQEENNKFCKKNDSNENLNTYNLNIAHNSNAYKNTLLNMTNGNVNSDTSKLKSYNGNIDTKHEKNIDSFICNNSTKNEFTNISSTECLKTANSNLKNGQTQNSKEIINSDSKKNTTIQTSNNNKTQFSSNDSNNLIHTYNQDNKKTHSVMNQKSQDVTNLNNSINKKIVNIGEANLISKKNSKVDEDSQKLREIKKNIYNTSNSIDNQDHSLTQKVHINNNPNLLKEKKFNLNEHITNNASLKLAYNSYTNNQHTNCIKKENESNSSILKNNQVPATVKNIISHPINNPIVNYINNSTNINVNNVKKDNQSIAFNNFDKKRYNLKKFQTSTDSNYYFFFHF
jgi:hypothetical protein